VPAALLSDVNLIERLGLLLEQAELVARELNNRVRSIAKRYLSPDGSKPDPNEVNNVANSIDPRPAYWARLEQHFFVLLEKLPYDWDVDKGGWKTDDQLTAHQKWRGRILREAKRALKESISSLGTTARAIQAVARVRINFSDYDLLSRQQKKDWLKTAKEIKETKGGK